MTKGNIQYTFCNKINNIYCNVSVNNAFSGLHYTPSPSQIYVIYIWSLVSQLVLSYWQPQYSWNIVESGIKYHKPTNHTCFDASNNVNIDLHNCRYSICVPLIDWLVFNTNFSNISAISWRAYAFHQNNMKFIFFFNLNLTS